MPEVNRSHEGAEFKAKNVETEKQPSGPEQESAHHYNKERQDNKIKDLSEKVEAHAVSGKELHPAAESEQPYHPVIVNNQIKNMSYSRTMTRVRKRLSVPSRAFSKVVHSPLVEKPSELASHTIARPSGMLGGSLVATVGTLALLWTVRRYGYEYNYLAVVAMFATGAFAGLVVEGAFKLLKRR